MSKIFGVGLSRTGTTSLAMALRLLGYHTAHWDDYRRDKPTIHTLQYFDAYDAASDLPVALWFKELSTRYSDARFIYTDRDIDDWLVSMHLHLAGRRKDVYSKQVLAFYDGDLAEIYANHRAEVLDCLGDRLLVLCIADGWEPLCSFLKKAQPPFPFPHANKRNGYTVARVA